MSLAPATVDAAPLGPPSRFFLSGVQALVRLPLLQRARDRAAGLRTAGFISGYRGSPLGGYDLALADADSLLQQEDIHFQPGLNEDLAATSILGTQQLHLFPEPRVEGVFGIWYGKGPGVDRSTDALKHGNFAGSSAQGGVLLIAGDDHGCQSSTLPHQSEQVFAAAMIPVLSPSSVQELLDFGLFGIALSRFSGCWIALKATAETIESAASVDVDAHRVHIRRPEFDLPLGGLNLRWPDPPLEQERRLHGPKMAAVAAFVRANSIDRLLLPTPRARLGILTAGKAYLDVRQAFDLLGLDERAVAAHGIRLYKPGLVWPLEERGALAFAQGLNEILVVEEKRGFVEDQLIGILYRSGAADCPRVVGKHDEHGAKLLPSEGELGAAVVARAIVARLAEFGDPDAMLQSCSDRLTAIEGRAHHLRAPLARSAFFCAGCPHNTSTRVPEGSHALAGIGCHGMVMQIPGRNTLTSTHMGAEGANWIGVSSFTRSRHVFQNLGDGTYQHSGLLAIRAAAVAGIDITYKILVNDAVAMTGGQQVEGQLDAATIAHQVLAEGARKVVVIAADPARHGGTDFPAGIEVRGREQLDSVQRELRETRGLTVLIYHQTCAIEARRKRRREAPTAPLPHVLINAAVCDDCGDCSRQSNCIAIKPLPTALGRKRTIDQSNCNSDLSCLAAFCPSFVTVHGARRRRIDDGGKATSELLAAVARPQAAPLARPYGILVAGIGGSGILTVGAILGQAAHLEGRGVSVLNFTGLSQKNGAVTSHVRIAADQAELHAVRLPPGGADLLLGCDAVVAASGAALTVVVPGTTRVIVNDDLQPTADFVIDNQAEGPVGQFLRILETACGTAQVESLPASTLAAALTGDAIGGNLILLGVACQRGLLPLKPESIERAIELNGVAVEASKRAFDWGRLAAADRLRFDAIVGRSLPDAPVPSENLPELVAQGELRLTSYQDQRYAQRFRRLVEKLAAAERAAVGDSTTLAAAVARTLCDVMAYKDEYEVARLHGGPEFAAELERQFEPGFKLRFHLAGPLPAAHDRGRPRPREYGGWMLPILRLLAHGRRLRGTPLDPFRYSAERRLDRQRLASYEALLVEIAERLTSTNHALAVELASLSSQVRGYGHVRRANAVSVSQRELRLLAELRDGDAGSAAVGQTRPAAHVVDSKSSTEELHR